MSSDMFEYIRLERACVLGGGGYSNFKPISKILKIILNKLYQTIELIKMIIFIQYLSHHFGWLGREGWKIKKVAIRTPGNSRLILS